jgi:hypothetical protein
MAPARRWACRRKSPPKSTNEKLGANSFPGNRGERGPENGVRESAVPLQHQRSVDRLRTDHRRSDSGRSKTAGQRIIPHVASKSFERSRRSWRSMIPEAFLEVILSVLAKSSACADFFPSESLARSGGPARLLRQCLRALYRGRDDPRMSSRGS